MKKIFGLSLFALTLSFVFASVSHAQHYVESGDTMYRIAYKNNMSLKDLISLNPHIQDPNLIHTGEYIIIRSDVEPQKDLVDYARSLQDVTAYKYGGNNFPYETDCSGFAKGVFEKFGVDLPRVSRDQARTGEPIKFENLQIGDLMFFSTRPDKQITHTGIYMGNDFWISNLNEAKDIEIMSAWGTWTHDYFMWGTRHKL
jgi:LysM repeat protein